MYNTLNLESPGSGGLIETPRLDSIINKQVKELDKVKGYYRENPTYIKSSHIIFRLVLTVAYGSVSSPAEAYRKASEDSSEISLVLGIADSVHYPKPQMGFSCKNTYLVSTDESGYKTFSPLESKWKEMSPIKILNRSGTKGVYQLPTSGLNSSDGFLIVGVDIPALSYMVKAFSLENSKLPSDNRKTISEFISEYLLPNTLYSQFDCIIKNVLEGGLDNLIVDTDWNNKVPFAVVDHLPGIENQLGKLKDTVGKLTMLPKDLLASIPTASGSLLDTVTYYPGLLTQHNLWFNCMSASKTIWLVFELLGDVTDKDTFANNLIRFDRTVTSNKIFKRFPEKEIGKLMEMEYSRIIEKI